MTLEQKVLARIRTEKVKPTARGWFRLRNVAFWGLLALSVALLGVGFGMVIFTAVSTDLGLMESLELTLFQRIFASVPVFWIIVSMALALLAFVNFRLTKRGYRISAKKFILFAVAISAVLGIGAYVLNITDYLDEAASANVPLYDVVVPLNANTWFDPENGLLSGTVREKFSDEEFSLRDRDAVLWTVDASDAHLPDDLFFGPGDRVRIVGEQTGNDLFKALQIHPWRD